MEREYNVCTGCALLCDDIELREEENKTIIDSACRKGVAWIKNCQHPLECTVDAKDATSQDAIEKAAEILKSAKNPLIFGMGNSSLKAQEKAIELAKKSNACIDGTSSFCQGPFVEAILNDKIKSCTLDEVRDKADVIVYWGCDPSNSHPRHLSKYSYFPRGRMRQRGWEEDRTAIAIDVRKSDTAIICEDNFYRIPPKADAEFARALTEALSGKVPKVTFGMKPKEILELANVLKKAEFGVIFAGLGLVYSMHDLSPMEDLLEALNKKTDFHLMPMVGQYNMRGFNHTLFDQTGYINRVSFDGEDIGHGPQYSVVEVLKEKRVDAALIIGSDPLSSLPGSIAANLKEIPTIVIDPCKTFTSQIANVTIPAAVTGVECDGEAIRMDGVKVELTQMRKSDKMADADIIEKIMEAI